MGTRKIILAAVIAIVAIVALVMLVMPRDEQAATAPDEASQSTAGAESTDQPSETAVFTAEEVATHNNASDCWTIINGNVYNVTSFISSHPGGEEILRACGIDATTLFTQRQTEDGESVGSGTPHSSAARSQLESLQIGRLAD